MAEVRKKEARKGEDDLEVDAEAEALRSEDAAALQLDDDAKKLAQDVESVGVAEAKSEDGGDDGVPVQLGSRRFVYAAFMGLAIGIAFIGSKAGSLIWYRVSQWKPAIGEPKDELVMILAGVLGAVVALYYWRKQSSRQYAEEVASELSKVTWPSKKEVVNSTTVVIVTTLFATLFFAVMDRFWGYVTNLVYGT